MDYLSPGLREFSRWTRQARLRWALRGTQKALDQAEIDLGRLGWLQADYNADTQREVDRIKAFERNQAGLTNQGAQVAEEITALTAQREARRERFEGECAALETRRQKLAAERAQPEAELGAAREQMPAIERRLTQLEKESGECNELLQELVNLGRKVSEVRVEEVRLRDRAAAVPAEISELRLKHTRARLAAEDARKTLDRLQGEVAALGEAERTLQGAFSEEDRATQERLKEKEREKGRIERQNEALEGEKASPYQQIGRVLADNQIAPMNQPQALAAVLTARGQIAEFRAALEEIGQESAQEDPTLLRYSLLIWGAIVLALLLVCGALWPR